MASLNLSHIDRIEASRDEIAHVAMHSVRKYREAIVSELAQIAAIDPIVRVQSAIVFSIVSPRCRFEKNVKATPVLLDMILSGERSEVAFAAACKRLGVGFHNSKGLNLALAAPTIAGLTHETLTRDVLILLRGIGMKVGSMAIALYDETARVITLDIHMLRGICAIAGIEEMDTATEPTYRAIESMILSIIDEHLSDVPAFIVQWAMWNYLKADQHESHAAIFGL